MMDNGQPETNETRLRGLLLEGLDGSGAAYHAFLKEMTAHLRAYFRRRLTGLPEEVEDLLQETLLALHNQRHTYDAAQPLTAWVHAIAKYKLIDMLRRRSHREQLHEPLDEQHLLFTSADLDAADARRDLAVYLERLPAQQRLPIVHMQLHGLSVAEAASLTGMSESAVKVGVHRGLKALAALFGAQP